MHVNSAVPWKAASGSVRAAGGSDQRRTTDAEEGLSLCMLFLVFVRDGLKVHGWHVVDSERTLAANSGPPSGGRQIVHYARTCWG